MEAASTEDEKHTESVIRQCLLADSLSVARKARSWLASVEAMLRGYHVMECWVLGNSNGYRYDIVLIYHVMECYVCMYLRYAKVVG